MIQWEHSAILTTFIKPHFVIRYWFCLFLSGRFTQVLLYILRQDDALVLTFREKNTRISKKEGKIRVPG